MNFFFHDNSSLDSKLPSVYYKDVKEFLNHDVALSTSYICNT
jgi:hypothetical protein